MADRDKLLDAAERAIAAEGPEVTMEAIAAAASVTKPILYRMVGDRDALVAALAARFVARINDAGAAAVASATDPRGAARRLIGSFVDVVDAEPSLFLFVTAGPSSGDRLGQSLSSGDRSAGPLAEQLARHRPPGSELDPHAALIWAHGIIGALQYATLWWLRDRPCRAGELADHLTQLLWSGMAVPSSTPTQRESS